MKIKIKLASPLLVLSFVPFLTFAQFVEEQQEQPSEFSIQGLQTFNTITDAINIFLALLFISSIIGFLVAGIKFVIAGGGEETLENARKTAMASLVGLILSLIGYVIINVIKHFLN